MIKKLVTLIAVAFSSTASVAGGPPLSFDFLVTGSEFLRPSNVFHDGENTYVEPPDNVPPNAITTKDAVSEQYGPYLFIRGIPKSFQMILKVAKKQEVVNITYLGSKSQVPALKEKVAADIAPSLVGNAAPKVEIPKSQVVEQKPPIVSPAAVTQTSGCPARINKSESAFLVGFEPGTSKVTASMAEKLTIAIGQTSDVESIFFVVEPGMQSQAQTASLREFVEKSGLPIAKVKFEIAASKGLGTELHIVRVKAIPCEHEIKVEAPHRGAVSVVANKADLKEILQVLADKLGMPFVVEGQYVPIQVSINDVEKPLVLVLDHLGKAVSTQADLVFRPNELVVRYRKGNK